MLLKIDWWMLWYYWLTGVSARLCLTCDRPLTLTQAVPPLVDLKQPIRAHIVNREMKPWITHWPTGVSGRTLWTTRPNNADLNVSKESHGSLWHHLCPGVDARTSQVSWPFSPLCGRLLVSEVAASQANQPGSRQSNSGLETWGTRTARWPPSRRSSL